MGLAKMPDVVNGYSWELYNIAEDFSQDNDLAAKMPDKLREMQELFLVEAAKYGVFPLDNDVLDRLLAPQAELHRGPQAVHLQRRAVRAAATATRPTSWPSPTRITADVDVPADGGDGMIVTDGGRFGGYGLYLLKGKPVFTYNLLDLRALPLGGERPARPWQAPDRLRLHL